MSELSDDLADLIGAIREVAAEQAWMADAVQAVAERPGHPAECRACPVCQGLALLRQVRPEAVDHLGAALDQLGLALRALLAPGEATTSGPSRRPSQEPAPAPASPRVERIEIEP